MTVTFSASVVHAEVSDYGIIVVQFSGGEHYVTFQRNADLQPNDWGNIHFECDGQGWGAYDVVERVRLGPRRLRVSLMPDAEEQFDGRLEYDVTLSIEEADLRAATAHMRQLFAKTELLEEEK
jgi:hypothetical protein